jgi:hypothetical protein
MNITKNSRGEPFPNTLLKQHVQEFSVKNAHIPIDKVVNRDNREEIRRYYRGGYTIKQISILTRVTQFSVRDDLAKFEKEKVVGQICHDNFEEIIRPMNTKFDGFDCNIYDYIFKHNFGKKHSNFPVIGSYGGTKEELIEFFADLMPIIPELSAISRTTSHIPNATRICDNTIHYLRNIA